METAPAVPAVIEIPALGALISLLARRGFQVIGPTLRDGAVVCDLIEKLEDLPTGWGDEQDSGRYRLVRRGDGRVFGFNLGPQAWKRFLHPPEVLMFEARTDGHAWQLSRDTASPPRYALLGVRACELAALELHDRVFLSGKFIAPDYRARRQSTFIVAVNCGQAARTCFCASLGTGPRATRGYDLCLTELPNGFVVETGSAAGAQVLEELERREATAEDLAAAAAAVAEAGKQARALDTAGLKELLYDSFDVPRWEKIAARCFACGNCTLVCPTCFCSTVEDSTDISCRFADRWRKWDSCFTENFSYIHGGTLRSSVKSRYRQWLTHKLAAWQDQYGAPGCVGCGRCITWCPGKIDITQEVAALRGAEASNGS